MWLLVSDLDGTLLDHDDWAYESTIRFAAFVAAHRDELAVIYNSSRFVASQLDSVEHTPLPEPDGIIGGMGTEFLAVRKGGWSGVAEAYLASLDRPWSGEQVRRFVPELLPGVEVQAKEHQSANKSSFYLRDAGERELEAIRGGLASAGYDCDVIYSSNRDLDVLPAGVSKASATVHLAEALGFGLDRLITSGDSGNDTAMLTCGGRAIVVANHQPELAGLSGERVYRAEARCADGVIEGLGHWMGV
ncbi:MAG: HAD-IIB family hydrolase [Planctomycetota bacterium]